ncbi:MAG TPA: hypothetical protein VF665_17360 [Longimicrobium sp.]|jgi:hypothetical protein|uniref:hypothetical protein n=1 Tax=Longimicrobium sp. TaxID=2029185 RepID=UPI002EDB1393
MRSSLVVLAFGAALAACGGNPPSSGFAPAVHGGARLIAEQEVENSTASSAYELIQQLRPRWLYVSSGPTTFGREPGIVVYVNEMRLGGLQSLREVDANAIRKVAFMDPNEATGRFGLNHTHGAILVSLKVGAP